MKKQSLLLILIILTSSLYAISSNDNITIGVHNLNGDNIKTDTIIDNQYIKVEAFNLVIPPPSSGVQFYRDGIVFLSSSKSLGKISTDHISFGKIDTHYALLKDSALEAPVIFSPITAIQFPSDAITFSKDYNTMYFTNYSKTDGCEKIYLAKFSDGVPASWIMESNPVSFCSDNSTYTHPALSEDGKLIVFASNRPGSVGGMDLYVSLDKGGKWSDPVNLGDAVNSSFNEMYPFLDSENNLFFSSDNTQGYGGYDVYVCKFKSNTWEKPINISSPVNSMFDDVAFKISRNNGKTAFYTVKQKSGKSAIQLYKVSMNSNRSGNYMTLSQYYTRPDISNMVILALEPAVQATDKISEIAPVSGGGNNNLVYRVQILTSFNPKTRSHITVGEKEFQIFEYLYSGAYRLCVGEFKTIEPAVELQNLLIKNDYPNASVVVFSNNVLSLDPELLKARTIQVKEPVVDQTGKSKPVETAAKPITSVIGAETKVLPQPDVKKPEPVKTAIPEALPAKNATVKTPEPAASEKKDIVVYRVQIFSGGTGGSTKVTVENKAYMTYEYKYNGSYKTCIGEFSTLGPAKDLQNVSRKSGYPQAFVVAFKNNVRSTDPALFK